jgi:hypothetical protein
MPVSDAVIISTFFGSSRGIKATARSLGIPMIYAAKVIIKYKKKHKIR